MGERHVQAVPADTRSQPGSFPLGRILARTDLLLGPLGLVTFLLLWQGIVVVGRYPEFILPSPGRVAARLVALAAEGSLWWHAWITVQEILGGLALGLTTASVLGYFLARFHRLEKVLSPYIVVSQAIPVVALAPLLVIWFGFGGLSKVLVCALVVFFPVLVNTVVGLRGVDQNLRDLMRAYEATRWQTFRVLELPAALPVLLGGLKVGVTLSVIGAVVGEFVGADRGLGFLVNLGQGLMDTPLMFVAIFALVAIALALYGLVGLLERRFLAWRT
ncbi:MAG: ABC transporter permease [Anaerolineae bacterium]|nr:ABC transporter permease [Anaerolineae bacterium]